MYAALKAFFLKKKFVSALTQNTMCMLHTGKGSYDSLSIHYMLNMRQGGYEDHPIVAWHQGGPGGSSTQVCWTDSKI